MTHPLCPRPPTTVMTQVIRPGCEVVSRLDAHSYLGPGKIVGQVPCALMFAPFAMWSSEGAAWDDGAATTRRSQTVFAANDPLLRQWSRTAKRRHHLVTAPGLSIAPMPGLAALCLEDTAAARLGPFTGSAEGRSTAIFGPRHVQASVDGRHTVATLRYSPGGASGWGNFLACSDPTFHPGTHASQAPSSVLLGMTPGDTAAAITKYLARMVLDAAINWVIDKVAGKLGHAGANQLVRMAERRFPVLVRQVLRPFSHQIADAAAGRLGAGLQKLDQVARGDFEADASDVAFADTWDEYVVSR